MKKKEHDYVTVVVKLAKDGAIVDYIGDGREEAAFDGFLG